MILGNVALVACAVASVAAAPAPASPAAVAPTTFDRLAIIVFENTAYATAIKQTYFKTLSTQGRLYTNYKAITHPSQGNYVSMIAGDTAGVTGDGVYNIDRRSTIVDLLEAKGISWGAYQENYPGNCFTGKSAAGGLYVRKHNPFISFTNISGNPARCAKIRSFVDFAADTAAGTVPKYVFMTPNMDNDAHDTSAAFASNWLSNFLPPLLANPYYKNTTFLVTFDEDDYSASNKIYTVAIGGPVVPGNDSTAYTHYSQLAAVEARWGLGDLGKNDKTAVPLKFF
ncbi:phosphoesterase family-domain-containing protein [Entophlyctis helioformis]|nr:phosphoesterase family-domain-containing protein [Entophlyctis helioformis]